MPDPDKPKYLPRSLKERLTIVGGSITLASFFVLALYKGRQRFVRSVHFRSDLPGALSEVKSKKPKTEHMVIIQGVAGGRRTFYRDECELIDRGSEYALKSFLEVEVNGLK